MRVGQTTHKMSTLMKKPLAVLALAVFAFSGFSQQPADKAMDEAKAVLAKMTLEEK